MAAPSAGSNVLPPQAEKAASVRRMFSAIAPRYDLLNHLLSMNRDKAWRRRAVNLLLEQSPADGLYLDLCAGTLDLSVELGRRTAFRGRIIGMDFTFAMLKAGVEKVKRLPVTTACSDALRLPIADARLDGIIVGFGVRNLASLEDGLRESARVLKPGGKLVVLEFTTPGWQPFRAFYLAYFRQVLPAIGKLISKHDSAYSYLPASVLQFPEPDRLAAMMEGSGFDRVSWRTLTGGIVAIHVAHRSSTSIAQGS